MRTRLLSQARGRAFLVAILSAVFVGMGNLTGSSSAVPERNYEGAFVDRDGVRVEANWINAGGELTLSGELGRGSLRVSFDDIERVEFSGEERGDLVAGIALREGKNVDLRVRSSLTFYGKTPLGLYQIRAGDLKALELRH